MVNKYKGTCINCKCGVEAGQGQAKKSKAGRWYVLCATCTDNKAPRVMTFYFPSTGETVTRNANGRCEDAPCCGCCT
jgi:hypothetical protein